MKTRICCSIFFLLLAAGITRTSAQCDLGNSIVVSGRILSSKLTTMHSYQWVTCPGFVPIPMAAGTRYYVVKDGDYGLIVKLDTCIDTVDCVSIRGLKLDDPAHTTALRLFPNPSDGDIRISAPGINGSVQLRITDIHGRVELQQDILFSNEQAELQTGLPAGHHILELTDRNGHATRSRLLIE